MPASAGLNGRVIGGKTYWPGELTASRSRSAAEAAAAAGPTMRCTQSGCGNATARSGSAARATASTRAASRTSTSRRLAATVRLRIFPAPPSAACTRVASPHQGSWTVCAVTVPRASGGAAADAMSGADPAWEAAAAAVCNAARISPASWSAVAPTTTCRASAEGRTSPRAPSRRSAAALTRF